MAETKRSEDILGEKWDRCVADTFLKIGGGVAVGVVFSAIIFKRKTWPIHVGIGTGLGMGIANCQHEFKDPYNLRAKLKVAAPKESTPAIVVSAPTPSKGSTEQKS